MKGNIMKKFIKITGIIVGSLVGILLLLCIFVPGLPTYFRVQKQYEYINSTVKPYPYSNVSAPDDYVTIECRGFSVKVPEDVQELYPDETEGAMAGVYSDSEKDTTLMFLEPTVEANFSLIDGNNPEDLTQEEFEKAMKGIKYKNPENLYEFYDLLFNITPENFSVFRRKTPAVFNSLAETKDVFYRTRRGNDIYSYETDNAIGFISLYAQQNESNYCYSYIMELFEKDNLNAQHTIIIYANDLETVQKIANSAELTEE